MTSSLATRRNVRSNPRGFTMIEVLIVVVILGLLAAIAIPSFGSLTDEAAQATFVTDVRSIESASNVYFATNRRYPIDGPTGVLPAGMETYLDAARFTRATPIGGAWDFEYQDSGITAGFGVVFNGLGQTRNDAYMQQIDAIFDGGDLAAGSFREIINDQRYYLVQQN